MTSRLLRATRCLIPVVGTAFIACGDDEPAGPQAALSDVEVEVIAPDSARAEEAFDIEVVVRNEASGRTAPLVADICVMAESGEACPTHEHSFVDVGTVGAGSTKTVDVQYFTAAGAIGFGGVFYVVACAREDGNVDDRVCAETPVHISPDIAALCEPDVVALPYTANTADLRCIGSFGVISLFAADLDAGTVYELEVLDEVSFHFNVFRPDGSENIGTGSTPDGKWFEADVDGTHYIAITPDFPTDFSFRVSGS